MAVLRRGILGGLRGKVANVVGSSWKGIDTLRSLPLSVANPRTAGQVAQRSKFSSVVALAKLILVVFIKPLWDRFAQRQSGYNAFVSANIDNFDSNGDVVDPAGFVVSQGSLTGAQNFTVVKDLTTIDYFWTDNSGTGTALSTDEVYAFLYNSTKGEYHAELLESIDRSSEGANIDYPGGWVSGDVIQAYISFRRVDGTLVSNSDTALAS